MKEEGERRRDRIEEGRARSTSCTALREGFVEIKMDCSDLKILLAAIQSAGEDCQGTCQGQQASSAMVRKD